MSLNHILTGGTADVDLNVKSLSIDGQTVNPGGSGTVFSDTPIPITPNAGSSINTGLGKQYWTQNDKMVDIYLYHPIGITGNLSISSYTVVPPVPFTNGTSLSHYCTGTGTVQFDNSTNDLFQCRVIASFGLITVQIISNTSALPIDTGNMSCHITYYTD